MGVASPPDTRDRLSALPTASGVRDWRTALWVCAAATLVRLLVAALTPLFPDETYYWEWSRHLAAGYFDHPPMIAWITALGVSLGGVTPFGVRLGSVLAGGVAAVALCGIARRLGGDRAALDAATIFAVMPLSAAGLVLATPDAPLFAFAAIACYALLRALELPAHSAASLIWWSATGLAFGCALSSKYTSAVLAAGMLLGFLSRRELRARFREPGPYVALILAVLAYAPVLVWNAEHHWISLTFQLRHGLSTTGGSILSREVELIGGQAGLVSPLLFVLCAVAVWRAIRDPALEAVYRLLGVCAAFVFAFFLYSATKRRVEANWPALAYIPAISLLTSPFMRDARSRLWLRYGIALAAVLTTVVYVNAFVPILPVRPARDPAARAHGWQDVASVVARQLATAPATAYVAADRYQDASELAFHLPGHPETFALNLAGRANQYDLWPRFSDRATPGAEMLLVLDDVDAPAQIAQLAPHFMTIARGPMAPLARRGALIKNLRIWRLAGWRGTWPQAALRSRP